MQTCRPDLDLCLSLFLDSRSQALDVDHQYPIASVAQGCAFFKKCSHSGLAVLDLVEIFPLRLHMSLKTPSCGHIYD
jgi:hypothetical protein